jgi:hypothetical protein
MAPTTQSHGPLVSSPNRQQHAHNNAHNSTHNNTQHQQQTHWFENAQRLDGFYAWCFLPWSDWIGKTLRECGHGCGGA